MGSLKSVSNVFRRNLSLGAPDVIISFILNTHFLVPWFINHIYVKENWGRGQISATLKSPKIMLTHVLSVTAIWAHMVVSPEDKMGRGNLFRGGGGGAHSVLTRA